VAGGWRRGTKRRVLPVRVSARDISDRKHCLPARGREREPGPGLGERAFVVGADSGIALICGQRATEAVRWIRDTAYREAQDTGYAGDGPQVMATLQHGHHSLLRIAGITKIASTSRHSAATAPNPRRHTAIGIGLSDFADPVGTTADHLVPVNPVKKRSTERRQRAQSHSAQSLPGR
jgi:hypothetical protein